MHANLWSSQQAVAGRQQLPADKALTFATHSVSLTEL